MISRGTIIFGIILFGHFAIQQLIPYDWQIFSYFIAVLLSAIIMLIVGLSTKQEKTAKMAILFVITVIAYALSSTVIGAFIKYISENVPISESILNQGCVILIYICAKIWMRITQELPVSYSVGVLFLFGIILLLFANIIAFIAKITNTTDITGFIMMGLIVTSVQIFSISASNKWDNSQPTTDVKIQ